MGKILRFALVPIIIILTLYACSLTRTPTPAPPNNIIAAASVVNLTKLAVNGTNTFNAVGQVINYSYVVLNTGTTPLAGPVVITDDKAAVVCPDVKTVGNQDANLDQNENITCASAYSIKQEDLNAGSVTNNATAKVGGIDSNKATIVVKMTENKVLALTKSASSTSYKEAGQMITYTYVIKNTGTTPVGPDQFIVRDDRISTPINCGAPAFTLPANESVSCTAIYTISATDMAANQLINTATASGGGAGVVQPATATITNAGSTSSTLTRGATIQHKVVEGEWMLQIARCYGASFEAVRNANPQVIDPNKIWPIETLTIPNIGSVGKIYGPPCIKFIIVQAGDTWNSIAQTYNADILVLQEANRGVTLASGVTLKIPLNSAGATQPPASNDATRLNFSAGSPAVTLQGNVNPQGKVRYVFTAAQGQTLTVKLTGPANELALGIYTASNTAVKAQDTTLTYGGTIPANGDYFIEVVGILGSAIKAYTLEASLVTPAPISQVERVADINSGAGDSSPAYLSIFTNTLYFQADGNDTTGAELWKYDSGFKAVSRAADVNPGANGSNPAFLAAYGNALYFRANGGDGAGTELWRYNGSSAGRMPDINLAGDSNPAYMTIFNNTLYFSANGNDGTGIELWKTDGTTVSRAIDIYTGTGDSNPAHLAVYNNVLYFSATSNDGFGTELWKYDGTNASRISDINANVGNSNPSFLTVFNNALYFGATSSDGTGNELWKYDGANVSRAADINIGAGDSIPSYLTLFNGALYFSANGNDGKGFELWKFDGTNASLVMDINKTGDSNPSFLTALGNELFFQANGGDGAGKELWKYKLP